MHTKSIFVNWLPMWNNQCAFSKAFSLSEINTAVGNMCGSAYGTKFLIWIKKTEINEIKQKEK